MLSYNYKDYYSEKELELINHLEAAGCDIDCLIAAIANDAYEAGFKDGQEYDQYCREEARAGREYV